MTGEEINAQIWKWLERRFPVDTGWQDPEFHCYAAVPLEIALVPTHAALEYNISNGGWSQVLWNCFGCWRQLLTLGEKGYALIGATAQAEAIKELQILCEKNETECLRFMQLAARKNDFSYFGKFTSRSYGGSECDWEDLFFSSSGVSEQRLAWLEEHEGLILAQINRMSDAAADLEEVSQQLPAVEAKKGASKTDVQKRIKKWWHFGG